MQTEDNSLKYFKIEGQIKLSIIVPVGRSSNAYNTINSILEQTLTTEFTEVILVGPKLELLKNRFLDKRIIFVDLPSQCNPAMTRSKGVKYAKGNLYLFIDDDIELDSNFLSIFFTIYKRKSFPGAVGARLPGREKTYFSKVTDLANFWSQQPSKSGKRNWLYSAVIVIPSSVYKEVGGFDSQFDVGEDVDLTSRIRASGYEVYYESKIVGYHNHRRSNLITAIKYFWQNGRFAKFQFEQEKALRMLSISKIIKGVSICTWNSMRINWMDFPRIAYHLPGIFLMFLIFNISLEYNYQRISEEFVLENCEDPAEIKKLNANTMYKKMIENKLSGNFYRSFLLKICNNIGVIFVAFFVLMLLYLI